MQERSALLEKPWQLWIGEGLGEVAKTPVMHGTSCLHACMIHADHVPQMRLTPDWPGPVALAMSASS